MNKKSMEDKMKVLILVMVLGFMPVWGQEIKQSENDKILHDDCVRIFSGGKIDSVDKREYLVVGLAYLYGLYEKECYADSSIHKEYEAWMSMGYDQVVGVGLYEEIWIHKEPTFQGFIEFLRRKSQKRQGD